MSTTFIFRQLFSLLLFLISIFGGFCGRAYATLSEQQKQTLFLESKKTTHHSHQSSVPRKKSSSTSHKKHHSYSTRSTKSSSGVHKTSTAAHASSSHGSSASGIAPSSSTSHDIIIPINDPNPIVIEKSGLIPDQGLEPPPEPTSSKSHGLDWLFGNHHYPNSYHYLSYSAQRAIERAHVRRSRWKYIIIHNSGTRSGNARIFDIYHRRVRKMVNGLAYHFVIGNGHASGDGEVEIGHRWTAQLNGGHVASDYLNDISLGICLVGDYNRDAPTKKQVAVLKELITCLRLRVGRSQGHQALVYAHKEINPRPTDCPGKRFPYNWLHQSFCPIQ
ncbi:MAG: peptidoglycan recognition protein family protein [Chthoniobacterales bacterium]|nr:peptidoglycan recognition protein family protein [Chthoniobacterales bacterium]